MVNPHKRQIKKQRKVIPVGIPGSIGNSPGQGSNTPGKATQPIEHKGGIKPGMYNNRRQLYMDLEARRKTKVLVYITGDRVGMETQIGSDALDHFVHHLDLIKLNDGEHLSLFLYTRGGDTLTAWCISNLLRQFFDTYEVIVPFKSHSSGTLICLGAKSVLMTKQATLGPIDPSVNTPLNPPMPGASETKRIPVSVEDINGFIELAREQLGIKESHDTSAILASLTNMVHPLVLGKAYRARTQIRMLAGRLLAGQVPDKEKQNKILDFLCSESGSHDYTINRREARDELGLVIEKPNDELYKLIKAIFDDISNELDLTRRFDPGIILGTNNTSMYSCTRVLLESVAGGSHHYVSEGKLTKTQVLQGGIQQEAVQDNRIFEGWRHKNA